MYVSEVISLCNETVQYKQKALLNDSLTYVLHGCTDSIAKSYIVSKEDVCGIDVHSYCV